jgi:tetratricopeptide (TPR) repeat protein
MDRARHALSEAYDRLRSAATRLASPPFIVADGLPDTVVPVPVVGNASTAAAFALLAAGKYDDAVAQLLAITPDAAGTLDGPLLRFAQAQEDEKENRISEARQGYVAALAGALAGRGAIYVAIGRLAQVEGDSPGAVDAFTHAVRLNPADQTLRQELASACAASGRVDDAFAELVAGLLVNPANATLHAAIGQLRLDADRPTDAIPAFTRALELNPAGYEVRYALANALTRVGKVEDAAAQLAMFEKARREMLERRRHDIQQEVDREEAIRRGLTTTGGAP